MDPNEQVINKPPVSESPQPTPPPEEPVAPEPPQPTPPPPPREPIPPRAPHPTVPPQAISPEDERTWAMLAHLSVLLNLISGFLGIVAALAIYLIYKDRSRYVRYQALQAFLFQLIFWGGSGLLIGLVWAVTGLLSAIIIGILLIPFAILLTIVLVPLPLVALGYGVWGGIKCSEGQDFRYWLIGNWALNFM